MLFLVMQKLRDPLTWPVRDILGFGTRNPPFEPDINEPKTGLETVDGKRAHAKPFRVQTRDIIGQRWKVWLTLHTLHPKCNVGSDSGRSQTQWSNEAAVPKLCLVAAILNLEEGESS